MAFKSLLENLPRKTDSKLFSQYEVEENDGWLSQGKEFAPGGVQTASLRRAVAVHSESLGQQLMREYKAATKSIVIKGPKVSCFDNKKRITTTICKDTATLKMLLDAFSLDLAVKKTGVKRKTRRHDGPSTHRRIAGGTRHGPSSSQANPPAPLPLQGNVPLGMFGQSVNHAGLFGRQRSEQQQQQDGASEDEDQGTRGGDGYICSDDEILQIKAPFASKPAEMPVKLLEAMLVAAIKMQHELFDIAAREAGEQHLSTSEWNEAQRNAINILYDLSWLKQAFEPMNLISKHFHYGYPSLPDLYADLDWRQVFKSFVPKIQDLPGQQVVAGTFSQHQNQPSSNDGAAGSQAHGIFAHSIQRISGGSVPDHQGSPTTRNAALPRSGRAAQDRSFTVPRPSTVEALDAFRGVASTGIAAVHAGIAHTGAAQQPGSATGNLPRYSTSGNVATGNTVRSSYGGVEGLSQRATTSGVDPASSKPSVPPSSEQNSELIGSAVTAATDSAIQHGAMTSTGAGIANAIPELATAVVTHERLNQDSAHALHAAHSGLAVQAYRMSLMPGQFTVPTDLLISQRGGTLTLQQCATSYHQLLSNTLKRLEPMDQSQQRQALPGQSTQVKASLTQLFQDRAAGSIDAIQHILGCSFQEQINFLSSPAVPLVNRSEAMCDRAAVVQEDVYIMLQEDERFILGETVEQLYYLDSLLCAPTVPHHLALLDAFSLLADDMHQFCQLLRSHRLFAWVVQRREAARGSAPAVVS